MTVRVDIAEHEAAHVVVGLALGLPLKVATLRKDVWRKIEIEGFTWFGGYRRHLAHGITNCAGVVWESRPGGDPRSARGDLRLAREHLVSNVNGRSTRAAVETGCRVAAEILKSRRGILARVARELCDRDLRPTELAEMVVGE
jgi:hypothetical protein